MSKRRSGCGSCSSRRFRFTKCDAKPKQTKRTSDESCVHCHLPVLDRNSRGFTPEFTAGIFFFFFNPVRSLSVCSQVSSWLGSFSSLYTISHLLLHQRPAFTKKKNTLKNRCLDKKEHPPKKKKVAASLFWNVCTNVRSPPCGQRQVAASSPGAEHASDFPEPAGNIRMQLPAVRPQSYTTVLREEAQSAGMGAGAWPSVGVSGPTSSVLLSMESSRSWEDGTESGTGPVGIPAWSLSPMAFIWLGTTETPPCPGRDDKDQECSELNAPCDEIQITHAPTEVHVEEAVWVDGSFVRRRGVVWVVDVRVFVGCVWRRRLLEMKRTSLSVIRQVQGREAGTESIWAVVKARDSSSEVEVVHCEQTNPFISSNPASCIRSRRAASATRLTRLVLTVASD